MTIGIWGAFVAYLVTAGCGFLLMRRTANGRLRFLMAVVSVMPLVQAALLFGHQLAAGASAADHALELVELFVSALCLSAMHILNRESRERRIVTAKLRLAEAERPMGVFVSGVPGNVWLRTTVSVNVKA